MIRIVDTENGTVRGIPAADPRITAFKGIPFAAPPIGENRWRAPQPCQNWDGILDCSQFGPAAVQDIPGLGTDIYCREWHVDPEIPMGEDCLYLNVWTNAKTGTEHMPVVVWFFGGAFQWGYPAEMEFDGERLARRDVVVVSVNYRLGAFGFLAHPELSATQPDNPGNFGSLDQQAGLLWVKRNIEAFGGDPETITLAGQSAGGGSVLTQMASETNQGNFQRAVIMSGMFRSPYGLDPFMVPKSKEEAEKTGAEFFDYLKVQSIEEARKLDATFIRERYGQFRAEKGIMFAPMIDGVFLTMDPYRAFYEGRRNRVPVMAGNTTDEFLHGIRATDEASLRAQLEEYFPGKVEELLQFPEAQKKCQDVSVFVRDVECGVKTAFLAESAMERAQDCYYYLFDPDIPGEDNPGTFHSVDLWFFFETLAKCSRPFVGRHYDLARQMCNYWANFIKTGDPNGKDADGSDLPLWEKYTKDHRGQIVFTKDGAKNKVGDESYSIFQMQQVMEREDSGQLIYGKRGFL